MSSAKYLKGSSIALLFKCHRTSHWSHWVIWNNRSIGGFTWEYPFNSCFIVARLILRTKPANEITLLLSSTRPDTYQCHWYSVWETMHVVPVPQNNHHFSSGDSIGMHRCTDVCFVLLCLESLNVCVCVCFLECVCFTLWVFWQCFKSCFATTGYTGASSCLEMQWNAQRSKILNG